MADNIYVSEENVLFIRDTEETIKNHITSVSDTDGGVYISTDSGKLWVGKKRVGVNFENGASTNSIQQEGTSANAENSFTVGKGTIAVSECQTVVGRYNDPDASNDALFVVGAGTAENKQNVLIVCQDEIITNTSLSIGGDVHIVDSGLTIDGITQTDELNVLKISPVTSTSEIDFTGSVKRTTSKPLDTTCVFDSYQAALDYIHAEDTTAYEGQVLTVKGITYIVSYDAEGKLRLKDIAYNAYYDVFETLGDEQSVRFIRDVADTSYVSEENVRRIIPRGETNVNIVGGSISHLILPDTVQEITNISDLSLKNIKLPNSLERIKEFNNISNLKSIAIPDSVTFLENIKNCSDLVFVSIGECVEDIGERVFENCDLLTPHNVIIDSKNTHLEIKNGCIIKDKATIVAGTNNYTIPKDENISSIGKYALSYRRISSENGGEIEIPENIETISEGAFYSAEGFNTVQIHGAKTIGSSAFYGCTSLASITIPNSVETIGEGAFENTALAVIHYDGSLEQWNEIDGSENITIEVVFGDEH